MKITGIDIGEYRQFKNIKFDFTYPTGHPKEGMPLEKVCFIGQSGTGKTTLLNIIWDLMSTIGELAYAYGNTPYSNHFPQNFLPDSLLNIRHYINIGSSTIKFDRSHNIEKSDDNFLNDWFEEKLTKTQKFKLVDTNKICLFIKDTISQDAEAFLVDQEKAHLSFSDFIKTDTEIEQEREKKEERIKTAGLNRVVSLGERKSMDIWRHILKDIFEYDETGKAFARNIVHEADYSSINNVIEKLVHWKKNTTNPRNDLANACLDPLLKHFFLETDIEGDKVPIMIRTKQGKKIDSAYLSTGTRQLLSTAIPIYKFDTTDTVILFDEPDRSLFPDIQRELIDYYTSLAPEAQFFFATHSPIVASAFEPCERFILYFDENGEVKCHNGVAPEGDDPNDILRQDFGISPLMLDEGVKQYRNYLDLVSKIKMETDIDRKMELIAKRSEIGNKYNFSVSSTMRRIEKKLDSLILREGLTYKKGNNSRIANLLKIEQNNICAYTEEYFGRADKAEIEHFDPTLKLTSRDGYQNWFLIKAQWNNEKGGETRWIKYQLLMHPTAHDFQDRIKYDGGHYVLMDADDVEASHTRSYLKLDDEELAKQRINYIFRLKEDISMSGLSSQEFIDYRLAMPTYRNSIYYIRAIEEELNVKVNFDLLKTK